MPPKRKASVLALTRLEQHNDGNTNESVKAAAASRPSTPEENQIKAKSSKNATSTDEMLPSLKSMEQQATVKGDLVKQGMPAKEPQPRKRKADESTTPTTPTAKRKNTTPKKSASKKSQAPALDSVAEDEASRGIDREQPPKAPLSQVVRHKIRTVKAFLESHTAPLLDREAGSNIAMVDEFDLIAALMILRVDFELQSSTAFGDGNELVVASRGAGSVSVDFDRVCDIERMAHEKVETDAEAGRLDKVNLVEVAIAMLVAKRAELGRDGCPVAGLRVYEQGGDIEPTSAAKGLLE